MEPDNGEEKGNVFNSSFESELEKSDIILFVIYGAKDKEQVCWRVEFSSEHTELKLLERFPGEEAEQLKKISDRQWRECKTELKGTY